MADSEGGSEQDDVSFLRTVSDAKMSLYLFYTYDRRLNDFDRFASEMRLVFFGDENSREFMQIKKF